MHSSASRAANGRSSLRRALDAPNRPTVSEARNAPSACAVSRGMVIILASLRVVASHAYAAWTLSVDDVIAAVDIHDAAGDEPGAIECKKRRSGPYIIDANQAARRGLGLRLVHQFIEFGDSGCRPRRQRTG